MVIAGVLTALPLAGVGRVVLTVGGVLHVVAGVDYLRRAFAVSDRV